MKTGIFLTPCLGRSAWWVFVSRTRLKGSLQTDVFPIESLIGPLVPVQYDMTFDYTVKHYFSTKHLPHSLHKMGDSALAIQLGLAIRETTDLGCLILVKWGCHCSLVSILAIFNLSSQAYKHNQQPHRFIHSHRNLRRWADTIIEAIGLSNLCSVSDRGQKQMHVE